MQSERRRYIRTDKTFGVQYALLPAQEVKPGFKKAEALNISAGGMKLAVQEYIEQDRELILQFILPVYNNYRKFKVLSVTTRAVSVEKAEAAGTFHIGVKFIKIRKGELDAINKYVMRELWSGGR
ncbi:MAG: PilZ domain-containing protein [Peptococcaceae bacterium]|nr:PilZ domain-containing protein [Peptococcaceae bacterium]